MLFIFALILCLPITLIANAKFVNKENNYYGEEIPITDIIEENGIQMGVPWSNIWKAEPSNKRAEDVEMTTAHTGNPIYERYEELMRSLPGRGEYADFDNSPKFYAQDVDYDRMVLAVLFAVVVCFAVVGTVIGFTIHNLYKRNKAAATVDYPAYGVTGPSNIGEDLEKKQQMISPITSYPANGDISDSDEDPESISVQPDLSATATFTSASAAAPQPRYNSTYKVYECSGLASQINELVIKNPLFPEDTGSDDKLEKAD